MQGVGGEEDVPLTSLKNHGGASESFISPLLSFLVFVSCSSNSQPCIERWRPTCFLQVQVISCRLLLQARGADELYHLACRR